MDHKILLNDFQIITLCMLDLENQVVYYLLKAIISMSKLEAWLPSFPSNLKNLIQQDVN